MSWLRQFKVWHRLLAAGVAGSIPAAPTSLFKRLAYYWLAHFLSYPLYAHGNVGNCTAKLGAFRLPLPLSPASPTLPVMLNDIRVKWPSEHSEWLLEAVAAPKQWKPTGHIRVWFCKTVFLLGAADPTARWP